VTSEQSSTSHHGDLVAGHQSLAGNLWVEKIFGSYQYFRLWIVQAVGSTGDWLGFLAIAAAATELGGGTPETAVGVCLFCPNNSWSVPCTACRCTCRSLGSQKSHD